MLFENASRQKIRFDSAQGSLCVEDLWEIPLTTNRQGRANLDDITKALFKQLKESETGSFVVKAKKADEIIELKFAIAKHIIDVRLAEAEVAETARANKEKKQILLGIIAQKENEKLMGSSLEELKAMVESL